MNINIDKLNSALEKVRCQLLSECNTSGYWTGRLSSSALSTATACCAFSMADSEMYSTLVKQGINWLVATQNSDGGWGDTPDSISNLPTTLLCWASIERSGLSPQYNVAIEKGKRWVCNHTGGCDYVSIVNAVDAIYGNDKTFSVPILTMCALCGLLGDEIQAWKYVKPLPFEMAALSPKLFKRLKLSVVSYALPALIAIGQVNYHHRKPLNPFARLFRLLTKNKTLELLGKIQPPNGGFLEATPLTSFVVMSLIGADNCQNEVVSKGLNFLTASAREDGSWPIDTNLATWATTLSVNALGLNDLPETQKKMIADWLLCQQYNHVHPYTNADPGGWAWTYLPGGVPDADDTAGALLALHKLKHNDQQTLYAVINGFDWLMDLQNSDGGIPTFCKGWSRLDFDRSSPDLTAHALEAMSVWLDDVDVSFASKMKLCMQKMIQFLEKAQQGNGSWIPLWFGNQYSNNQLNPVYGTSRVLLGLCCLNESFTVNSGAVITRAIEYLLSAQNSDGSFGGDRAVAPSIEETAVAIDALANLYINADSLGFSKSKLETPLNSSVNWLLDKIQKELYLTPSPIGLYFAKLWYSEQIYPLVFSMSALRSVVNIV